MKILEEQPYTSILVTGGSVAADEWRRRAFPVEVIRQFVPVDTPAAVHRFITYWWGCTS
jgi:3-deoxy-D-manno-octulosonic-acid transferase